MRMTSISQVVLLVGIAECFHLDRQAVTIAHGMRLSETSTNDISCLTFQTFCRSATDLNILQTLD